MEDNRYNDLMEVSKEVLVSMLIVQIDQNTVLERNLGNNILVGDHRIFMHNVQVQMELLKQVSQQLEYIRNPKQLLNNLN